jgi:tetraacyldisaccharide 4'-kinase
MINYLRWLLLPFSWLYGLVVTVRNFCYDTGIFKSVEFEIPVISVGNLEAGGAGKSPMTEYLVRLLKGDSRLATLSRGYGRKTSGFFIADATSTATQIGDEPAQFKQKFTDVTIAVCEKRVYGIQQLKINHNLIILDDAYQHRAVKPGFSILLFDFNQLTQPRFLLPAGNMREPFTGRKRANIIVVTKCPANLESNKQRVMEARIKPYSHQQVFFSSIVYSGLTDLSGQQADELIDSNTIVFLLTGIANPAPLITYIEGQAQLVVLHKYPDHHQFSLKNIIKLADEYKACKAQRKLIVTTEKDAQRLRDPDLQELVKQLNIFTIPIKTQFLNNGQQNFDQLIQNYVREHTPHNNLY